MYLKTKTTLDLIDQGKKLAEKLSEQKLGKEKRFEKKWIFWAAEFLIQTSSNDENIWKLYRFLRPPETYFFSWEDYLSI